MASTKKTPTIQLSQFEADDHPSFLTDYNADMSKLDTEVKSLRTASTAGMTQAQADARYVPKAGTAPESTGLTAAQFDKLYVDENNIIRIKTGK